MRVCMGLIVHVNMCVCVHIITTVVSIFMFTFVCGFYSNTCRPDEIVWPTVM